jgi:16S rRNA (uracil1498-N3)-methyltransferase
LQRIAIAPTQIDNNYIALTLEQCHYLTRVIRLQNGAQFQAIDGTGKLYLAELQIDRSQQYSSSGNARIISTLNNENDVLANGELSLATTLICALPKGNHFDDIVRACTELGVTNIYPAISDRTLLVPSPQKLQRWRKIAQEAAEQSERFTIPTIADPQPLQTIFSQLPASGGAAFGNEHRYLCEARGDRPHLLECLQFTAPITTEITIAIGPEGGWTPNEIDRAIECDFQLVSLGRQILRTITAPIVALSIVSAATCTNTRPQVLI